MFTPIFNIKNVPLRSRVMLAPMAGVTDAVFRSLVRLWSEDSLIFTEMISSNALILSKQHKAKILESIGSDHPIAYQLSGHNEEILLKAALYVIETFSPEIIDLNMGCPVRKITGNFEGCSLMREPDLAASLISALVKEIDTPVTVKFRLGWDHSSTNYIDFGRRCEDAGASLVTLHARTRSQGYSGGCKWDAFGELKQALSIPVVANGNIRTADDAEYILRAYGVDAIMIGRGCQGKPWLIGEIDRKLKYGTPPRDWPVADCLEVAYEHAKRLCDYLGHESGIRAIRKHLAWYIQGFPGAARERSRLTEVNSLQEIEIILKEILEMNKQSEESTYFKDRLSLPRSSLRRATSRYL